MAYPAVRFALPAWCAYPRVPAAVGVAQLVGRVHRGVDRGLEWLGDGRRQVLALSGTRQSGPSNREYLVAVELEEAVSVPYFGRSIVHPER
jgi:hypothetical protein